MENVLEEAIHDSDPDGDNPSIYEVFTLRNKCTITFFNLNKFQPESKSNRQQEWEDGYEGKALTANIRNMWRILEIIDPRIIRQRSEEPL